MTHSHAQQGTKERLLQAGAKVFSEKGFLAATIREICQLAEANIAAVNYHFGDKQSLYDAVLKTMFAECATPVDQRIDPDLPAEERLAAFILESIRDIYGDSSLSDDGGLLDSLFHMELAHPSSQWEQLIKDHFLPESLYLRSLIREILGSGHDEETIRQCCISIYGMMTHHALCWPIVSVVHQDHPPMTGFREQLADHVTRFSLAALRDLRHQQQPPKE
ncbi:transcriptional regulator, TetR family [Paucidesulfovibrio gracilis DSM 16080]|uniref:Transcriptional regulator, TetR family n=1 Tax=Paucidesulfovibrio gracilis DSM 16080 TaxID=1121449 RepID=A0A1T4W545_9BACT|nr:TetR/AcrR family transcriptional regulator [Paucidesulfovibrio gracilis]SKA72269.1 transcriptional regulator, TetR family [Paucidesulfovibrio gracilis DSM 16080]